MGELHQVRCDNGGIISKGAHSTNPWHLRPLDEGVKKVGGGPTTYVVYFPRVLQEVKCPVPRCPVPGCPAVSHSERQL